MEVQYSYKLVNFLIKLDNGYIFKRHIDQLRSTRVKKDFRISPDTKGGKEEEEEVNLDKNLSIELGHYMEFPKASPATTPHEDIPEDQVNKDYTEFLTKYY